MNTPPPYVPGHGLLQDKVVLITAASGAGIGFATALKCAQEGAHIFMSDIHEKRLAQAKEAIQKEAPHSRLSSLVCDVSQQSQVDALKEAVLCDHGRVDVVFNNAGLGGSARVVDMTDDQWGRVVDITLTGTFRMIRAFLPVMIEKKAGVIINNASVIGWRAQKEQAHYAAAKAGVMALTRCSALEAAEHGVRINAIAPSLAMHPFLEKVTTKEVLEALKAKEAFGRPAEVWEVANVVVFLASEYSSYLVGEVIPVSCQHP